MHRITATDVPYVLSFHTSAKDFLHTSLTTSLARVTDRILVLNYADYIKGCGNTDMYSCCLAGYTPQDFIESEYFMENLIHGDFSKDYYSRFLKTLQLFGIEVASLAGYLRYLEKDLPEAHCHFKVIPTFPVALLESLSKHELLTPKSYKPGTPPQAADWLEVIGRVTLTFAFTGNIDWFQYIGPSSYTTETYSAYIFDLLRAVSATEFTEFLVYEGG